jgi:hypothetical protein
LTKESWARDWREEIESKREIEKENKAKIQIPVYKYTESECLKKRKKKRKKKKEKGLENRKSALNAIFGKSPFKSCWLGA